MKNNYAIDISLCKLMDISPSGMMVLENIHFLCANTGWCFGKKKTLSDHHGYSKEGFRRLCRRLEDKGLLKTNKKGHLKTTQKYKDFVSVKGGQQSSPGGGQQSSPGGVNKVALASIKKELKVEHIREEEKNTINYQQLWNNFAKDNDLSAVAKMTSSRQKKLALRVAEIKEFDKLFLAVLEKISDSRFLLGQNDRNWKISFDWLIENDLNMIKVYEGKYDE